MTNALGGPVFPPGRYGRRREPRHGRRWLPVALAVLVALAASALVVRLYSRYGDPPYQATVPGVDQLTDSSVTVAFTVRKHDTGPAVCRVQAKDRTGAEVGYAEVPVGAGGTVPVRYQLATRARPYAVDVLGCRRA